MRDFKQPFSIMLDDEIATAALASAFTQILQQAPICLFLHGGLGAGKTFFTRQLLQDLGCTCKVKSPTYTLVEPYVIKDKNIYHFDLYRLNSPLDLEMLGIRDYLAAYDLLIVEWAENGEGFLPNPDLEICFTILTNARKATITAATPKGVLILQHAFNI